MLLDRWPSRQVTFASRVVCVAGPCKESGRVQYRNMTTLLSSGGSPTCPTGGTASLSCCGVVGDAKKAACAPVLLLYGKYTVASSHGVSWPLERRPTGWSALDLLSGPSERAGIWAARTSPSLSPLAFLPSLQTLCPAALLSSNSTTLVG